MNDEQRNLWFVALAVIWVLTFVVSEVFWWFLLAHQAT